jgi:hypothetical protein
MPLDNLGRIGLKPQGDWVAGTYRFLDVVSHDNIAWVCGIATTTEEPGAGTDWDTLVEGIDLPAFTALKDKAEDWAEKAEDEEVETGKFSALHHAAKAEADAALTAADVVLTHADVVSTDEDATQTAADRVQTGLDRTQTGLDVIVTNADAVATGADRTQTGLDVITTTAAKNLAEEWAANPEGVEVEAGLYSARHYAGVAAALSDITPHNTSPTAHDGYLVEEAPQNTKQFARKDGLWAEVNLTSKTDKVSGAVENNLAALDSVGNLIDSGTKPADFTDASDAVQTNLDTHTTTHPAPTVRDDRNDPAGSASTVQGSLDTHIDNTTDAHGIDTKVDKVTGFSLVLDTEISKIHEAGSDDQDLSGLVEKVVDHSLVADSEIAKIHTQGTDSGLDSGGANAITASTIKTHVESAHAPSDANNYTHPANHDPSIIAQDASNRFVTDAEKSTWNGKEDAVADHSLVADTEIAKIHAHTNKATLDKVTESGGLPVWDGGEWPGGSVDVDVIRTPMAASPLSGATGISLTPTLTATAYGHVYGTARDYRQFQIDIAAGDFSDPVYDETENADTHTVTAALNTETSYKWRCKDVSTLAEESEWTTAQAFETANVYTAKPTNTDPTDTETDIGETPTLTSDAFECVNDSDTHASSDWEIYDDTDALIYSSYDDTSNKTTLSVPEGELEVSSTYTWRVRHTGTTYGDSEWSTATEFTTKAAFVLIYGIAQVSTGGGAGTWARVDANGDNITLTSTDFDNHPIWGGIETQTIDGQQMVKIPKFWFKVGDAPVGSDRAGKKCWWISDTEVSGFSVHPAFMDSEVEIDQFWIGAYEASDDGGTKVKSVSGVAPLASTSFDDFVTKIGARNTGGVDGFHMPDIHELAAIQMLALIEMGTPDAQSAIDVGNDSGSVHNTGVDDDIYRGIYQLWSNVFMWVDGLRTTTAETIKIYDNVGNQTWVVIDTGLSANRNGYPVTMKEDTGTDYDLTALFIADTFDATDTNGTYADKQILNKPSSEDFVCRHGGYWYGAVYYGLFYVYVYFTSSDTTSFNGARLAKR